MKVFITGASGFIGSYLFRFLVNEGHEVLALKRESTNLYRIDDCYDKARWILDTSTFEQSLIDFKPEIIFNLAWKGVAAKERTEWSLQESNIQMQQRLLEIAVKCGTKKFIGVGSQAEYGAFENKIDESYPENPNSAYGAVKFACKTLLKTFCEIHRIEWYWFRVFPCFGPTEDDHWLIPSLIKSIYENDHMDLTPGEQKLSYLYVGEVAKSIMSPINLVENKSGVYNICADNPTPLKELVSKIRDMVNPDFKLNFGALQYRYGQCMYMEGDSSKLCKNLYSIDTANFDKKLKETVNYYTKKFSNEFKPHN
ncbi:MAG: NAD(P)-dependent oxidoreductase [Prevotellaceae bacterium]|nr:NAD(P)-dependent oxidoreductase [Candidatus Faecinaster equi]